MASLRQAVDRIRQREGSPPPGRISVRKLLPRFSLTPRLSVRALIASDRIGERYNSDGRSNGPVGFPVGGVRLTASGALQPFSGGIIRELAGKIDPVVSFRAHVRFLGFRCNEEADSDQLTSSDEPYFVISVTGIKGNTTRLYGPFEDEDGGESRFATSDDDVLATDVQPPFTLSVLALEHDLGRFRFVERPGSES